jgi:hypothetical protein
MNVGRVKWYVMEIGPLIGTIVAALALATGLCSPAAAQISMQRPGITGIPQARKQPPTAPQTSLTADEQKRLSAIIKHMKPKDRKKLAKALQTMTPQQRQQLVASVKKQLAQTPTQPTKKTGW